MIHAGGRSVVMNSANDSVTSGEEKRKQPQRNGPSNCLAKTQVYAKPKGEVYGLTPARCWKVKGRA